MSRLQIAVEEGRVDVVAEARRRDQRQRQRLDAWLTRESGGDGAAERMADEMRRARPLLDQHAARRLDQRLEARVLAQRREPVAGQIDRQRRERWRATDDALAASR